MLTNKELKEIEERCKDIPTAPIMFSKECSFYENARKDLPRLLSEVKKLRKVLILAENLRASVKNEDKEQINRAIKLYDKATEEYNT